MSKIQKIMINSKNVVSGTNNSEYNYTFPSTRQFKKGSQMCLSKLCVYYSWFNINATLYNNNIISYKWFNSSGVLNTTINVTIPDGFYSYDDITEYLCSVMTTTGHYIKGSTAYGFSLDANPTTSSNFFFIRLRENQTYYACELDIFPLPPSATSGITKGSTSWALPTSATQPQFILSSSNNSKLLFGFDAGTFGGVATTSTSVRYSTYTPQITPANSIILLNSLIRNDLGNPATLFYSFSSDVDFGKMIIEQPSISQWLPILEGSYSNFSIYFKDQDLDQVYLRDNSVILEFMISEPEELQM